MEYKYSRYNWLIDYDTNCLIIANGFTGSMAQIKTEYITIFRNYFGKEEHINRLLNELDNETRDNLIYGGFLVEIDFDERRMLEHRFRCKSYAELSSITVVPTMECNFNCTYCYQEGGVEKSPIITDEVIDQIVVIAKNCSGRHFQISFTGGEPLLYPERVIKVCKRVQEARSQDYKEFSANVITNGYLLDKVLVRDLHQYGVHRMQITIDGDRDAHNRRRPLRNGAPTYDRIVNNAIMASEYLYLNIRVNCESTLDKQYISVKKLFEGNDNVRVSPASTRYDHKNQEQLTKQNVSFLYERLSCIPTEKCISSFRPKLAGCSATNAFGIVILPDGSTCKCWHEISGVLENRYGSILSSPFNPFRQTKKLWPWLDFNPYVNESPCYECRILPNCGGACPAKWILEGATDCTQTEYLQQFENIIRESASRLINKTQDNNRKGG